MRRPTRPKPEAANVALRSAASLPAPDFEELELPPALDVVVGEPSGAMAVEVTAAADVAEEKL